MTQAFNLSQFANKVNTSGQADLTTAVTGTLPVANGGTGATTLTSGSALVGNGTGAVSLVAAGALGNVLTSNGTTWTSAAASGGGVYQAQLFTSSGTWTKPATATTAKVTVIGGGSGSSAGYTNGGTGGIACAYISGLTGPVSVTVGAGGAGATSVGTSGGTSSFGSYVSATGGQGNRTDGTGTISSGTGFILSNTREISNTAPTPSPGNYNGNFAQVSVVSGYTYNAQNPSTSGITYSLVNGGICAGAAGSYNSSTGLTRGGVSGAVIVEFVG